MTTFKMSISNIKNIKSLDFEIPTEKGLYAITGENGAGKSTLVSSLALSFYVPKLNDYLGLPQEGAKVRFKLDDVEKIIETNQLGAWENPRTSLDVSGFFEGSVVYGNRFKSKDYELIGELSKIKMNQLYQAPDFIKESLGTILRNNSQYYEELYILKSPTAKSLGLNQKVFFYKKDAKFVSQLQMSTGENLMLTILSSLENKINNLYNNKLTYIILDEIELALHSAAIHRFILFLESLVKKHGLIIISSTHSSDILRRILPENIYFLQNNIDGKTQLLNPTYPAFATRRLESAEYGYDFLVFVEDNLAKNIIEKILKDQRMLANKKVLVVPVGGWQQVLRFANDVINSHLAHSSTKIMIVLDRDIKDSVPKFKMDNDLHFSKEPQYLPVKSIERYLLDNLITDLDYDLLNELNDYVFQSTSVESLIQNYNSKLNNGEYKKSDGTPNSGVKNGKNFYYLLKEALKKEKKDDMELISSITDYLFSKEDERLQELIDFFSRELL